MKRKTQAIKKKLLKEKKSKVITYPIFRKENKKGLSIILNTAEQPVATTQIKWTREAGLLKVNPIKQLNQKRVNFLGAKKNTTIVVHRKWSREGRLEETKRILSHSPSSFTKKDIEISRERNKKNGSKGIEKFSAKINSVNPKNRSFKKRKKKSLFFNTFKTQNLIKKKTRKGKSKIRAIIHIRVTPNNIFCTFRSLKKTLVVLTAGIAKLKVSKRKLKYVSKFLIEGFIEKIKLKIRKKTSLLHISAPVKIRKKIIKQIIKGLKYKSLIINMLIKKSFNGCRAKKAKRKKRKGFRVFK